MLYRQQLPSVETEFEFGCDSLSFKASNDGQRRRLNTSEQQFRVALRLSSEVLCAFLPATTRLFALAFAEALRQLQLVQEEGLVPWLTYVQFRPLYWSSPTFAAD